MKQKSAHQGGKTEKVKKTALLSTDYAGKEVSMKMHF